MTQDHLITTSEGTQRRTRGPKPYPVMKFEDVLILARTIAEHGPTGQLRRMTMFDRMGKSPDSGPSRALTITSSRYGLTSGGKNAEHIVLTEIGHDIVGGRLSEPQLRGKSFECAIGQFDLFRQLYERLKNLRLPAEDVLCDQLTQLGLDTLDTGHAAEIFLANAKYVGLIKEVSGSERLVSIEQLIEELPDGTTDDSTEPVVVPTRTTTPTKENTLVAAGNGRPSLHIDIQVHIDPTSSAEQIDQIFASMAKHFYGHEA